MGLHRVCPAEQHVRPDRWARIHSPRLLTADVGQTMNVYRDDDDSRRPVGCRRRGASATGHGPLVRLTVAPLAISVALLLFGAVFEAEAQQPPKVPRIGVLGAQNLGSGPDNAFRDGLRQFGYVEGKNIAIEWRSAHERAERFPELAADLVRLKVEVIVATNNPAVAAAQRATTTIPIVMVIATDPVRLGFVTSLGRLPLARLFWLAAGKPIPPPPVVKQQVLLRYAERFAIARLVETGTFRGDMVDAVKRKFRRIWSIELDASLYRKAATRFARYDHIFILHGDSGQVLPEILAGIGGPCLFWLDAHYSGPGTAKGNLDTPIMDELQFILNHPVKDHIILIDDARCFIGQNDYPPIRKVRELIASYRGQAWAFLVKDDIIRIHKPTP